MEGPKKENAAGKSREDKENNGLLKVDRNATLFDPIERKHSIGNDEFSKRGLRLMR